MENRPTSLVIVAPLPSGVGGGRGEPLRVVVSGSAELEPPQLLPHEVAAGVSL